MQEMQEITAGTQFEIGPDEAFDSLIYDLQTIAELGGPKRFFEETFEGEYGYTPLILAMVETIQVLENIDRDTMPVDEKSDSFINKGTFDKAVERNLPSLEHLLDIECIEADLNPEARIG